MAGLGQHRAPGFSRFNPAGTTVTLTERPERPEHPARPPAPGRHHPAGRPLPALHPQQPGATAITRHLRQPARRRVPRQPGRHGRDRPERQPGLRRPAAQRPVPRGDVGRRRRRRGVHDRVRGRARRQHHLRPARLRRGPAAPQHRRPTAASPSPTRSSPRGRAQRRQQRDAEQRRPQRRPERAGQLHQLQPDLRPRRHRQVRPLGLLRRLSSSRPRARSWSSPCPAPRSATRSPARSRQKTFVLQAPAGSDPVINDGSASVPFDTTLVFDPGLDPEAPERLACSSRTRARPSRPSAGPTRATGSPSPRTPTTRVGGDTERPGGQLDPAGRRLGRHRLPQLQRRDRRPHRHLPGRRHAASGPTAPPAVSGADDSLSILNFTDIRYAGGAVPATQGTRYDAITLYNSRPDDRPGHDHRSRPTDGTGGRPGRRSPATSTRSARTTSPAARWSAATVVASNSLNGICIRADLSGVAEPTDADRLPRQPAHPRRRAELHLRRPPALHPDLAAGRRHRAPQRHRPADHAASTNRLYIQPGMMFKFQRGAGIEVVDPGREPQRRRADLHHRVRLRRRPSTRRPACRPRPTARSTPTARRTRLPDQRHRAPPRCSSPRSTTTRRRPPSPTRSPSRSRRSCPGRLGEHRPDQHVRHPADDPNQPTPGNVPAPARWGSITIDSGAVAVDRRGRSSGTAAARSTSRAARSPATSSTLHTGPPADVDFDGRVTGGRLRAPRVTPGIGARVIDHQQQLRRQRRRPDLRSTPTACSPPTRSARSPRATRSSAATS